MRAWMDVAVLAKAKGHDGRLVAKRAAGLPLVIEPGDEVAFVPPRTDVRRRAVVASADPLDGASASVRFVGVESAEEARELVGMHCLVRRDAFRESALEEPSDLWRGWTVVDRTLGEVGEVAGIVENPAQSLIVVNRADGSGSALVPAVDEIVKGSDPVGRMVDVDLPVGLLDLRG